MAKKSLLAFINDLIDGSKSGKYDEEIELNIWWRDKLYDYAIDLLRQKDIIRAYLAVEALYSSEAKYFFYNAYMEDQGRAPVPIYSVEQLIKWLKSEGYTEF